MDTLDYIPIAALNHYDYCPMRCYYMFVAHEFDDNVHTVEGTLMHERVHSGEITHRGDLRQLRSVYLYSDQYGLTGKADLIEEREGEVYPIEYKKGRRGHWINDQLQLCAQALCLEEMLGRNIERGYLFYAATGRRKEVALDEEIRQKTSETIDRVREMISSRRRPEVSYSKRCRGCSLERICLPKEKNLLNT